MKKMFLLAIIIIWFPTTAITKCTTGNCVNGVGVYVFPDGSQYMGVVLQNHIGMGISIILANNYRENQIIQFMVRFVE
jgi:hypothetical protein